MLQEWTSSGSWLGGSRLNQLQRPLGHGGLVPLIGLERETRLVCSHTWLRHRLSRVCLRLTDFSGHALVVIQLAQQAKDNLRYGKPPTPAWDATWYAEWDNGGVGAKHREYYSKWVANLGGGISPDLAGNRGYIFLHMKECIADFQDTKDIAALIRRFDEVIAGYGEDTDVQEWIANWSVGGYLFLGDYCGAWDVLRSSDNASSYLMNIDFILFLARSCGSVALDGKCILNLLGNRTGLTEAGDSLRVSIVDIADEYIAHLESEKGVNLLEHLYSVLGQSAEAESHAQYQQVAVLTPFGGYPSGHYGVGHIAEPFRNPSLLSRGKLIQFDVVPQSVKDAMEDALRVLIRQCENAARKREGLPGVGEGWVSEMRLYKEIKSHFPTEIVRHHARPAWLGRQHLDIYFPSRNVAVEYQGAQHFDPVEYLGGAETFNAQLERDARKRGLCDQNDCTLIEVAPDYVLKDVLGQIEAAFKRDGYRV